MEISRLGTLEINYAANIGINYIKTLIILEYPKRVRPSTNYLLYAAHFMRDYKTNFQNAKIDKTKQV